MATLVDENQKNDKDLAIEFQLFDVNDSHNRKYFRYENDVNENNNELKKLFNKAQKNFFKLKTRLKTKSFYKSILFSRLPFIKWLFFEYNIRKNLVSDIIAGCSVGIMNMPQSMSISMLANLPPVIGLYMSFFPLLMYFFLGTSKQLALGT